MEYAEKYEEEYKAYGTVFHMNKGNPFKVKALVDKWPDFNTVVIRPQEEDMTDDLDHYTNTYLIYSKDPVNCQKFLGSSEVINWKQHLQIQSSQSSLDKVIEHLADINLGNVKHTQCFLYMVFDTAKKLLPSLVDSKNLDMADDLDHYTNTYLIYSKDPVNSQKFLSSSEVINWKQHLQIQSSQSSLDKVIEHLADINLGNVKHTQCFLYMLKCTVGRGGNNNTQIRKMDVYYVGERKKEKVGEEWEEKKTGV
ncbi:glycine N-acyltransferase-like protein Keg1-like protein [Cricetulus griseus]|uniref:Glycine N-acyltransferase-like protein n=1 Tax=Cricetulus griseus TaxID=10029 RepID=A0A061IB67_CRIGR|nr:glycine N-acyltransferase-like protein Keg1-like protein [Cricetulus griseus]